MTRTSDEIPFLATVFQGLAMLTVFGGVVVAVGIVHPPPTAVSRYVLGGEYHWTPTALVPIVTGLVGGCVWLAVAQVLIELRHIRRGVQRAHATTTTERSTP